MKSNSLSTRKLLRRVAAPTIALFCLLFCFVSLHGCSRQKSISPARIVHTYPIDSLDDLILNNLRQKRIVMIGDAGHGHGYYMKMVTDALNRWLDELDEEHGSQPEAVAGNQNKSKKPPLPDKLILFVESDSINLSINKSYMKDGDVLPWLKHNLDGEARYGHLPGGLSVDRLEYLADLRKIEDRVRGMNANVPSHPYDFRIMGAESTPSYDYHKSRDSARAREFRLQFERNRFEYFAHQRDEQTSARMRKELLDNPEYKALVFYGTAHLLRGRQDKALTGGGAPEGIDQTTTHGYYIAHYLDEYFSRDSVSIFFPVNNPGMLYGVVHEFERGETPDCSVMCDAVLPTQKPLELISCQTTLRAFLELMEQHAAGQSEDDQIYARAHARRLSYLLWRSYLGSRRDVRPLMDSLWRSVRDTSKDAFTKTENLAKGLIKDFDAVENINALDAWIAKPMKDSSAYLTMLKQVLMNLPTEGIPFAYKQFDSVSLNDEGKEQILRHREDLMQYFLVDLQWIGTPDEQQRARNELIAKTGLKYETAEEWSAWWRSRYR